MPGFWAKLLVTRCSRHPHDIIGRDIFGNLIINFKFANPARLGARKYAAMPPLYIRK